MRLMRLLLLLLQSLSLRRRLESGGHMLLPEYWRCGRGARLDERVQRVLLNLGWRVLAPSDQLVLTGARTCWRVQLFLLGLEANVVCWRQLASLLQQGGRLLALVGMAEERVN